MKHIRNKTMYYAAVFVTFAVYNVVVWTIPFRRDGGNFWVGYGFSTLAILFTAAVGQYALGREGMKSKFYGLPLAYMAWTYLVIQLIVGMIEMALPQVIPFQYGLALNAILLGGGLIGLISVDAATEEIERLDVKVKEKVFYIKSLMADVEGLVARAADESARKNLRELVETIRYSDPMSSPQLAAVENKIEAKAAALADSLTDAGAVNAQCVELQQLFAERNRKCKLLK